MYHFRKKLLLIFMFGIAGILYSRVSYSQQVLNCNFTNYSNSGYIERVAKTWVNPSQSHTINGNTIKYVKKGLQAQIIENSPNKIKWKYKKLSTSKTGSQAETVLNYVYFKTNNKVGVDVIFTGYNPINTIWGTCSFIADSKTKITKITKNQNNKNKFKHQIYKDCSPKYANSVQEAKSWKWNNCFGIIEYKEGKWEGWRYEGEFYNGLIHGKGKSFSLNGTMHIGEFKYGKKNGKGTSSYSGGDKYVGEYKDDKRNGSGTYYYLGNNRFKGDKYVGEYKNDKPNGLGTYYFLRNDKYKGDKYVGEFKNGKRDGLGVFYYLRNDNFKGDRYVGQYKNSKKHGRGNYIYKNGIEYIGEYKDGKRNGEGIWRLANGIIKYEGVWKNDKFQYAKKVSKQLTENIKSFAELINKQHQHVSISSFQTEKDKEMRIVLQKKSEEEKRKLKALEKQIAELKEQNEQLKLSKKKRKNQNEIGSGFYVSKFRHIVTNQHVINKCYKITVGDSINTQIPAELIASDKSNDLALLQTVSMEMASADTKSFIQKLSIQIVSVAQGGIMRSEDVVGGEEIFVAGYPLGNMVSDQMKLTDGIVSATKGLDNDTSQFEISSVVKKGNSGGPVYDRKGNIVGVVVERFNVNRSDNVNFAIKGSTVKQFLSAHNISTKWSNRQDDMSAKDIYKTASKQTVMVVCHR